MAAVKLGFSGRVAVITGAGGGLGRAYALEFARRGASVVVNDLGGSFKGDGKGTQLADSVVKEITDNGGRAVANYDTVENGENIIATAIKHFGKVDILINNAGILRDRSFLKITDEDWDKVFQVHVRGAFKVTKAAWPHMRKQKYGRIIMTASPSGLYGNFGQANYSSAKLALLGLANTLAIEGGKANINVNTIAPVAETRMTVDILGESGMLKAEHIAPFVLYLCHESCTDNGSIIETGGGFAAKIRLEKSQGAQLREFINDNLTVEKVAESWSKLTDFTHSSTPTSIAESSGFIMENIQNLPEHPVHLEESSTADAVERMKNHVCAEHVFTYTEDDVIKYALSVGAKLPLESCYLYEGHSEFSVIPTFPTINAINAMGQEMSNGFPGMEDIDLSKAIHGEQYVELYRPIPTSGKFTIKMKVIDALNKKKFCQIIVDYDILDENGDKLGIMQVVILFLGSGGIGRRGKCKDQVSTVPIPSRPPDATCEEKTTVSQAALYRLNGDKNPLHIDPDFATAMGFSTPILHGLCSFGFAMRHVLKTYADNDSSLFKAIKVQFSKPVIPGDTLVTEMWCEGSRIIFQMKNKDKGSVVLKGGFVDLNIVPKVMSVAPEVETEGVDKALKSMKIMENIVLKMKEMPDLVKKAGGKILIQITKAEKLAGECLLDFDSIPANISYGSPSTKPDATLRIDDEDFEDIATGGLNETQAYMSGKIKISGKFSVLQNLFDIFKASQSKL